MISSDNRRYAYGKSQLIEVICQLRFPTILSIDTREPADFQETVRAAFPRYQCQVEKLPGVNGAPARTVNNHTFISEDGGYKLSLTKDFIALSTMRYTHWEDFAARLDEPLGQFIKIYRPNCFDRVGLRFVNAISREQLGLTGRRWNDLLQPPYLGILDEDGVDEASVAKCSVDVERKLDALAVAFLWLSGVIPLSTYAWPILASATLLPAREECRKSYAWSCFAAAAVLGLLLCADKEAALVFCFLGYYPLVKPNLDAILSKALRLFAKLGLCTVSMGVMYALIIFVFKLPAVVQEFSESATWLLWATAAMGLLLFFVYDLLIDRLAVVYRRRRGKKA